MRWSSIISLVFTFVICCFSVCAGPRFQANVTCHDGGKRCASGAGERIIGGFKLYKNCWEWEYEKECDYPDKNGKYPSKNDCKQHHYKCAWVGKAGCYLYDSAGECVNVKQEFSCTKKVEPQPIAQTRRMRTGLESKDGLESWVCDGIPCIDGNCFDKSYNKNGEIFDAVSQLYAANEGRKGATRDVSLASIFVSAPMHCSRKPTEYTDCCSSKLTGWGSNFGAGCKPDEKKLLDFQKQKRCEYVGAETVELDIFGALKLTKLYHCCFPNLISKAIRVGAAAQKVGPPLDKGCKGISINDLANVDFSKIDRTEIVNDLKERFMKTKRKITTDDIQQRMQGIMPNDNQESSIRQDQGDKASKDERKRQGLKKDFHGDKE